MLKFMNQHTVTSTEASKVAWAINAQGRLEEQDGDGVSRKPIPIRPPNTFRANGEGKGHADSDGQGSGWSKTTRKRR